MDFVFLDMAGKTLFTRSDAERAEWTQEEMSLTLMFPYMSDKNISTGQRVFFIDPATGAHQIYEVKQARTIQPDAYQEVTAEHICISELTDDHLQEEKEIQDKSIVTVLSDVLKGTLWSVGKKGVNPKSSVDLSRGSVWQAILDIRDNYNVYITPRVTLASNGKITRLLDISDTAGTWSGVRLSIDKNMLDPSVTYDDSNVATALYGYGGSEKATGNPDDKPKDITFADVVWTKTSAHPAKPKGQKYLEDPAATKLYGRNGRPRFAYYQNTDIEDPNILLQKTWEKLQTVSVPAISIDGSVADLYRMGYADQPIKLHDLAIVEVLPIGFQKRLQIIRMTVDLLDPTATTLTIGDYIPNIIYINRDTNEDATGSRGGGGGNQSDEKKWQEFRTTINWYNDNTGMSINAVKNDNKRQDEEIAIQEGKLEVTYNKITAEVTDRQNACAELAGRITVESNKIALEVTERKAADKAIVDATEDEIHTLSGRIDVEADKIALVVTEKDGQNVVNTAEIVAGINDQEGSYVKISADTIDLRGYVTMTSFNSLSGTVDGILAAGTFGANKITSTTINATGTLAASSTFNYKGHTIGTYTCETKNGTTFYALGYT